jgi:hypothetical protein
MIAKGAGVGKCHLWVNNGVMGRNLADAPVPRQALAPLHDDRAYSTAPEVVR